MNHIMLIMHICFNFFPMKATFFNEHGWHG